MDRLRYSKTYAWGLATHGRNCFGEGSSLTRSISKMRAIQGWRQSEKKGSGKNFTKGKSESFRSKSTPGLAQDLRKGGPREI